MKKKIVTMASILLSAMFLMGFAINGIDLKHIDDKSNRLMNLNGMGTASELAETANESDKETPTTKTEDKKPEVVKPTKTTPTPTPKVEYDIYIKVYGETIKQAGANKSLDDVEKMAKNNKVIKVHVNCEYGDYQVVEDVRQILGDKFVEDNGDAE